MRLRLLPIRLDSSDSDDLDRLSAFVEVSPQASVFHTLTWNRIVAQVFATDFTYLAVLKGVEIAGVMPCHVVHRTVDCDLCYSPPRLFEVPYGGPLAIGPRSGAVAEMLVRGSVSLGRRASVDVFNAPENSLWVEESRLSGRRFETAYVNLVPDLDDIWKNSLDSKRRNMIRKAEKSGVEVRVSGLQGLPEYLEMAAQTVERAGFKSQPADYYSRVLEALASVDGARLYLARRDGRSLAGGIFLRHRASCYYWHGASATDAGNYGQGELIQWEVIKWARSAGCEFYDLVGVERERLPNIARFKLGFTKQVVPFYGIHYRRTSDRFILKAQRTAAGWSSR